MRLFVLILFFSIPTFACTCMELHNIQQAAQKPKVIIAQVKTQSLTDNGKAIIKIDKVWQGSVSKNTIEVLGQDGVNCNGSHLPVNSKGVLLFRQTTNGYETLSCAETAIPLTFDNLYKVQLGEDIYLNASELKQVLTGKLKPTIKSADCQITVERTSVPYDNQPKMNFNYTTTVSGTISKSDVTTLKTKVDLSKQATQIGELSFSAAIQPVNQHEYKFNIQIKDPFTGTPQENWSGTVDTRKSYHLTGPEFNRLTDADGKPYKGSDKPFLSHQLRSFCQLNIGKPLISAN